MKKSGLLLLLFLITASAQAQTTRYVTDQLSINMRSGQSTQHKIIRLLPSGTALEVLEEDKESGYSRVRTSQGNEGWVLTRQLSDIQSARDRLASAEQKLAKLDLENKRIAGLSRQQSGDLGSVKKERDSLSSENQRLNQEITRIRRTAASALALDSENKSLKERLLQLERDYQMTQQENSALKDRTARDWFMVGAGVVILGMGIGLIIPKIRWRKKSSWDSL